MAMFHYQTCIIYQWLVACNLSCIPVLGWKKMTCYHHSLISYIYHIANPHSTHFYLFFKSSPFFQGIFLELPPSPLTNEHPNPRCFYGRFQVKRALKSVIQKCTHLPALEPLLEVLRNKTLTANGRWLYRVRTIKTTWHVVLRGFW